MKKENRTFVLTIGFLVLALVGYRGYTWYKKRSTPGQFDEFAKCLSEEGVRMYGTNVCGYCQDQKELFGNSFKYINYVNCNLDRQECVASNVEGYPTWVISDNKYTGVQSLERLASLSSCQL